MSEENNDKPFDPSEQKLRKAREKGDVPRSLEVNALLAYAGLALVLLVLGPHAASRWLALAASADGLAAAAPGDAFAAAQRLAGEAAWLTLALLVVPGLLVLLGLVVQGTLIFSPQKLAFDLKRLNPVGNAKQKFGLKGLVTFGLSLVKVALAMTGGWLLFGGLIDRLGASGAMRETQWVGGLVVMLARLAGLALAITAALTLADVFWKRHEFRKRMGMTRKEMEDEHKDSEGDPHLKQRRRQRAVDIAMSSMLADVERADVVIVNPTHYAVALQWKRGSGRAPVCLAKGVDEVAARIRARAEEHRVPIWSDPPCARALHAGLDIGDEIPAEQFAAVAAAIRFAEAMRLKVRAGW
ncbi:flagellar type III secretion system protein FlhB [Paracoccus sp. S-4012]|uniref:EscU/YscU/HrcU family type III secretion system export apparatus switch protein n=1 Tax=Paracoccus sp. S-4012 TaxID=2665648 RepID=UPI0012B117A3|nr:EscU/YscU/HrcU family type III secretion system export apparatus switch protein [Paracoccus sp. S-4012]MRX49698.1 flagellar type III secretion system protein FlhB [Paracoccus sp. S-4012]